MLYFFNFGRGSATSKKQIAVIQASIKTSTIRCNSVFQWCKGKEKFSNSQNSLFYISTKAKWPASCKEAV